MTIGSRGYSHSGTKTVATTGYVSSVPVKTTVSFKGSGGEEGSYQNKSRFSYGDKQSGCYGRARTTEKQSAGEFHWKNGTTGTKSEYTQSSTVRVGDKTGYTEVYNEQRVRNVVYDKSGCSSENYITYNNDDGGPYGCAWGYGNEDSDDEDGTYGSSGFDEDDDGPYDGPGYDNDEDGPYDDSDYDNDDDGTYGGSDYENDDYGSDGGYGYDSDY